MKKIVLSCGFGILLSGFFFVVPINIVSAQSQTGHWVDVYMGSPIPVLQVCAGSGSVCISGDWRPPVMP